MSEREFAYWLWGLFELDNPTSLDERQTQIIKDHLKLVFHKVTPNRDDYIPVKLPDPIIEPWVTCGSVSSLKPTDDNVITTCSCEPKSLHPYGDGTLVTYNSQGSC